MLAWVYTGYKTLMKRGSLNALKYMCDSFRWSISVAGSSKLRLIHWQNENERLKQYLRTRYKRLSSLRGFSCAKLSWKNIPHCKQIGSVGYERCNQKRNLPVPFPQNTLLSPIDNIRTQTRPWNKILEIEKPFPPGSLHLCHNPATNNNKTPLRKVFKKAATKNIEKRLTP